MITDQRVSKGIKQRIDRGEFVGRTPLGYDRNSDGDLVINESESDIVRLIYDMYYNRGMGLHEIARELNNKNITRKKGHIFYANNVDRVLKCPTYFGKLRYRGKLYPGKHEALFEEGQFKIPGGD